MVAKLTCLSIDKATFIIPHRNLLRQFESISNKCVKYYFQIRMITLQVYNETGQTF